MKMLASGVLDETSTSEDPWSEDENEDLSRALKLSIVESNINGANKADVESSYVDEDEQLARALLESFKYSRKSSVITTGTERRWWKKFPSSLNIIQKFKQFGQTSWTSPILKMDINHQSKLVCDVCEEQIDYAWSDCPYWGQTLCYEHMYDGTPWCSSCLRFKLGNIRYINLSDGRKLCPDCHSTAITDTEKCIPLFNEVYGFFKGLNMKIIKDIPFFLVDQDELNKKNPQLRILGATTYHSEVITSVARSSQRGENIEVVKEVQYLSRKYEVTSMLILYGLSKLEAGATLAHEMMHAWMRLEGYRRLEPKVEEGICEVMAHRWLDWHTFVGDDFLSSTSEQAEFLRNLKEVLKERIERNYCETYGGGFRDAKWAVERYGLKYTMKHIGETGKFPQ